MLKKKDRIVIVGDLHLPYPHEKALKWAHKKIKDLQPTQVVQLGDIYDFYYFSKYPKKFLEFTPHEELRKGYNAAAEFWHRIQSDVSKTKCIQMLGNHDERPFKRMIEKVPELEPLFNYTTLFKFVNVNLIENPKEELILKVNKDKVMIHHGYLTGLGKHMRHNNMNCVVGHTHKGGVLHYSNLWELNVGYLGDPLAGPLQYGTQARHYWTHGLGYIDEHGPRFIPYK